MSAERFDLLSIGRAAVDLYGREIGTTLEDVQSFDKSLGGSPANVAVGASRLGLRTAMLTRVGDEAMGRFVRETLRAEGVDVSQIRTDPDRLTGLVLLSIRGPDRFPLVFYRERCADMGLVDSDVDPDFVARANVVHVTGTHFSTSAVDSASRAAIGVAKASGGKVVLDIDYRPVLWGLTGHGAGEERFVESVRVSSHLQSVLPDCDVIVGTEEEIQIAGGDTDTRSALERIRQCSGGLIVMKRGPLGCVVYDGAIPEELDGGHVFAGAPVDVVNVLGAGDAFLAGFLSVYAKGGTLEDACGRANAAGALVVSRHACAPAMPTLEELQDYLSRDVPRIDRDERIATLHRTTTRRGGRTLHVLAFDHRTSLAPLGDADRIRTLKGLIARAAREGGANGMIVDEEYGRDVLVEHTESHWLARPIEVAPETRSDALDFLGAPNMELEVERWPRAHVVKCLVSDPVDDDAKRATQIASVRRLFDLCVERDRRLMLEVLPVTADGELAEDRVVDSVQRYYEAGIRPDWWKLSVPPSFDVWRRLDAQIEEHDPHCLGVVLLGFGRSPEELAERLKVGRRFAVCRGFAVGRTIFAEAAEAWFAGDIDDDTFVARVKERFVRVVRDFGGN